MEYQHNFYTHIKLVSHSKYIIDHKNDITLALACWNWGIQLPSTWI